MTKDKKILYLISFVIFAVLLLLLFANVENSKILAACVLLPLALATFFLIKKRGTLSINKASVTVISAVVAVIYILLMQFVGTSFGIYQNPYFVNVTILIERVIPIAAIIVEIEIIRHVLLVQKSKLVSVVAFISCILADVLTYSTLVGITNFNEFMDLVGMTLFPAISANIYYHYVSKNYGIVPNVVFRLITALYVYFIPTMVEMTDALEACIKLILPIIMLTFVSAMFSKKKRNAVRRKDKFSTVGTVIIVVVVIGIAMLISCQFRFGALVIATESMTGEINKGDMIIYERYEDQTIEEGQVIVFTDGGNRIVHRVIRIETIGDETRYYTKGDANKDPDIGYRTESDIFALTDVKIPFVGYPTLWLRELIPN